MTATMQSPPEPHAADPHRPLRIAMVAPPWFELPPSGYGGIESVVAQLVDQLSDRGHEVTLIAAGRHLTKASHFYPLYERPPSERLGSPCPEVFQAAYAASVLEAHDVDVVHDHTLAGPLLARGRRVPTVTTMHGPAVGEHGEYYERLGTSVDVIAISDSQRRLNRKINWIGRVHNAVDVASFPFQPVKDDYVLWLGRFNPEKAPHLAIDAARTAGFRVVLAGKLNEAEEKRYFDAEVRPRLGPDVDFVGEADATHKRRLLAGARCLAFPLQWEEPFGVVMVEAMACGTPVVALRRGSVPEVVKHGVSGLIVDDFAQFPDALRAAVTIDAEACRHWAATHFDLPVMAAGYERLYRQRIAARVLARPATPSVAAPSSAPVRRTKGGRTAAAAGAGAGWPGMPRDRAAVAADDVGVPLAR